MPTLPKYQRFTTDNYELNQIQNNITKVVETLAVQPLTVGNLLKSVPLVTGDNSIFHGLGAPLQGWMINRIRDVSATFYDKQDTNPTPTKTLILTSSADVTVDLVVF